MLLVVTLVVVARRWTASHGTVHGTDWYFLSHTRKTGMNLSLPHTPPLPSRQLTLMQVVRFSRVTTRTHAYVTVNGWFTLKNDSMFI